MRTVQKKVVKLQAWQLGTGSEKEKALIASGKIVRHDDDVYELFSTESVNGKGEIAHTGDYFKVDSYDAPYPNTKERFEEQHAHLEGDWYRQASKPLLAWFSDEPMCEEVEFLIQKKGLILKPDQPERYFNACLWNTHLSSPKDSALLMYEIERDAEGRIMDIHFNFVERREFERTYEVLGTC